MTTFFFVIVLLRVTLTDALFCYCYVCLLILFPVSRLEDKETETKKEYNKLHDRYSELFKTHLDYMERTKSMLGTDKLEQLQAYGSQRSRIQGMALNQLTRSSGPVSFGYSELENNNAQQASILTDFASQTTPGVDKSATSLKSELKSPLEQNNKNVSSSSPTKPKVGNWTKDTTPEAVTDIIDLEVEEVDDFPAPESESHEPKSPLDGSQVKSQTKT